MLVPKLRFKEFEDSWTIDELGNFVDINSGDSPSKFKMLEKGIPYFKVEQLNNCYKYQDNTIYHIIIDKPIKKGSIIFPKRGAAILLNKIRILKYDSYIDTNLMSLTTHNINNEFLYYYLLKSNLSNIADTSSIPQINNKHILPYKIRIPALKEQCKISKTLSLLDQKIELQQRKIEVLKMYKRGLINKLYTSLDCSEVQIKDIGKVITGTTPSKDNLSYWSNGTIVWVTPSDITEFKNISDSQIHLTPQGLNAGRKLPKNTLLITCIASIGKNAILKVDGSCNQQINAIIPCSDYDIDFLYYLFEYKKSYMQSIAGTSATSIINKSSFEKILLKIPKISVQKNIAKNLSAIDYKIEIQQHLLDRLFTLKKSLLQQMFI